jgi:hypothetical protein
MTMALTLEKFARTQANRYRGLAVAKLDEFVHPAPTINSSNKLLEHPDDVSVAAMPSRAPSRNLCGGSGRRSTHGRRGGRAA